MKKIYLSVIIPAYNESENFSRGTLNQVYAYLKGQKYLWEMILVNDGSSDNTLELLNKFSLSVPNVRVINNPHQGKAATIISGALAASGEVILFSDLDQATPIFETDKVLAKFSQGFDIVIGSRANRKGAPVFRYILAYGMVVLRTLILRLPFKDTQCGFKAFSKSAGDKIFNIILRVHPPQTVIGPSVDPGFDVEMLYLGRKLGYKIAEVPVSWHYQESRRVRFLNDAISGITGLLLVRFRSLTNAYGL